jgi:dihydroorotate dehydrogenase (NAD+) catalytic subunit
MAIQLTRMDKNSLIVENPVMPAAGTLGFGDTYSGLIQYEKLGAFVTAPVTYHPFKAATGTRVVQLDGGMLMHTGLPNPGISKVLARHRQAWEAMPVPIILHIVVTSFEHVRKCASRADAEHAVDALELGLNDDINWKEAEQITAAAVRNTEKPVLVRLPVQDAFNIAGAVAEAGAGAVVACAPPRGSARDPYSGRMVSGRIYGPLVKPQILRIVGQLAEQLPVPVIASGGIHNQQDAHDFLDAGARAVQVDAATWIQPRLLEFIARDLGGLVLTREAGALGDEWHPGIGLTEKEGRLDPWEKPSRTGR